MLTTILNVNSILFTVLGYPMSYVEFFGTVFTAWSVFLAAKNKVSTWPVSIVGIILYGFLFYQIQLYSDLFEQVYYFITAFWGWYLWTQSKSDKDNSQLVFTSTKKQNLLAFISTIIFTFGLAKLMENIHLIFPVLFPIAASYPLVDSFTTILSFVATIYLARRRVENWYLWILVDVIGVWLYYQKGVIFLSILYFAFLINAIYGLIKWQKLLATSEKI